MPDMQKMWVGYKQFFRSAHHELWEPTYLIVQDAGMNHANMVRDVVAGLQEALQQEPVPVEFIDFIQELQVAHM